MVGAFKALYDGTGLDGQPVGPAFLGIAPGAYGCVARPFYIGKYFPDGARVIRATLVTDSRRFGKVLLYTAAAFDRDAIRLPLVDRSEFHVFNFVVALRMLNYLQRYPSCRFPSL